MLVAALLLGVLWVAPQHFFDSFPNREFSAWERLLTESRVLVLYLYWLLLPLTRHYTLFHDDIVLSHGLLEPVSTLLAIVLLSLLSLLSWHFRRRWPLAALAWFWFLLGHAMESSFLNLELVFEHRNYLPIFGPVMALVFYVYQVLGHQWRLAVGVGLAAMVFCAVITGEKAHQWRSDGSMLVYEAGFHLHSTRLNYKLAFLREQLAKTQGITTVQQAQYVALAEQAMQRAAAASNSIWGTWVDLFAESGIDSG